MTMIKTARNMVNRLQQRVANSPGAATKPSDIAMRSVADQRLTLHW